MIELKISEKDFACSEGKITYKGWTECVQSLFEDAWYVYRMHLIDEANFNAICVERTEKESGKNPDSAEFWLTFSELAASQDITEMLSRIRKYLEEADALINNKGIFTTQYQGWKTVALMRGLGFTLTRSFEGDTFTSESLVKKVYEGWIPSKDGSKLLMWEELGEPDSPHFNRYSIQVFEFENLEHTNYLVWKESTSDCDRLFEIIALSSKEDWENFIEKDDFPSWEIFLEYNGVKI